MSRVLFAVSDAPLDVAALTSAVSDLLRETAGDEGEGPGAIATFLGLVRNRNKGRRVLHLDYEAYAPLAVRVFERIAREIGEQWPQAVLGLHHRTGRLAVGEASVAIVVASPHRADAFAASRYAIERVKQIAPVWKREWFDGGDAWIEGASADPEDAGARAEALRIACA
jgi:molybdopterin synthase catalytic subunit